MGPQIENKSVVVTNGFDPEDFQSHAAHPAVAPPPPGVLRIVHTGMFHSELAQVWDDLHARRGWMNKLKHAGRPINLWTRTPRYLLAAMHEAIQSGAMRSDQIELVLVGEITGGDRKLVESSPVASSVKMLGYRTHEESVAWLRGADVLFLPNHTPLDGGPALIVPGKTYEYLAARRPILAMGPPGDWRDFVRDCESGDCIDGEDVKAATAALVDFYRRQVAGGLADVGRPDKIAEFSREHVARKVAAALDRLLK
jgi:glycosyltransferase involved in cell wall biosynthesis